MKEKKTLKHMMIKSVILFCLVPFLLLWLSFALSSFAGLKSNIESEQRTIVRLLGMSVENYFYEIEESMEKVTSDSQVQNILKTVDRYTYDSRLYNADQYIQALIGKTCLSFNGVENIIVADMDGGYYSTGIICTSVRRQLLSTDTIKDNIFENRGKSWITQSRSNSGEPLIILAKPIVDLNEASFNGMMYFVIRTREMDRLLKGSLDKKESILLTNRNQETIYAEQPERMNASKMTITSSKENSYGLTVTTGVSVMQYARQMMVGQLLLLLLFASASLLVFILVQYIYRKISSDISAVLHRNDKGAPRDTTYFEIRQINDEMMSLMEKNDEGAKKIVKLMNHCDTMTLDKLQAQINPHFLYNTLTSIKYMAIENGQKQISDLITALVKLLRSTINREGSFVSLIKETENVKNYICIQNAVYKGNIDFQIQIPDELHSCMVPNFILQPLVENCIFHGIHPEEAGGRICITAGTQEQKLSIAISDNGDGFSDNCLVDMMGAQNNKEMMTNFGLKGVQQKIQIVCGPDYGLFVTSTRNHGSTVEITLPIRCGEEGERSV